MADDKRPTLILTGDDIAEIVRRIGCHEFMDLMTERMHRAFAGFDPAKTSVPVRDGFHYAKPASGLIEWMPLYQHGRTVLMKMVGYHPANPHRVDLPTVLSTMSLFDATTGSLVAIADGVLLTAIRTGAASAVATRLLAVEDSRVLGMIGCGAQAVTQVHAISRVLPVEMVRYFDTDSHVMESFSERVLPLMDGGLQFIPSAVQEVVECADVLCTATSVAVGSGPVFRNCRTQDWLHINAVGSDLAGKTELPLKLLQQSLVCPDFPAQAQREGECQQLSSDQIGPSLLHIARHPEGWPDVRRRRTVFDSTGWALEDFVAMELARELADRFLIGTRMHVERASVDPWNPYEHIDPQAVSAIPTDRGRDRNAAGDQTRRRAVPRKG